MAIQGLSTAERRVAPRFEAGLPAELASGTVLVPVQVLNLSATGCGVVITTADPDLPQKLGGHGLVHLPAIGTMALGTILPVVLRNLRSEGGRMLYGLEFCSLLAHQTRKLNAYLETMSLSTEGASAAPRAESLAADVTVDKGGEPWRASWDGRFRPSPSPLGLVAHDGARG